MTVNSGTPLFCHHRSLLLLVLHVDWGVNPELPRSVVRHGEA